MRHAKKMPSASCPSLTDVDIARFWSTVDVRAEDECWLWLGGPLGDGYGGFSAWGRTQYAHRVSLFIATGNWPTNAVVMHSCDVRRCVNPRHLRAGTAADNNKDRAAKGRSNPTRGERHRWSKLTAVDVMDLRGRYSHASRLEWSSVEAEAARLGVTPAAVYQVITRRTWKHL